MRLLIFATLIATASCQFSFGNLLGTIGGLLGLGGGGDSGGSSSGGTGTDPGDNAVDQIHDWRVEDHQSPSHHLLLFINDNPNKKYCYVVVIDRSWEHLLTSSDQLEKISDEIYAIIMDPSHTEHPLHPGDIANDYGDFEAAKECAGHDTYSLDYRPSWMRRR